MTANYWQSHAKLLTDAFARHVYPVRYELVTRAILMHLPPPPQRIVDVGGGFGRQAIALARAGHHVTVVDFDRAALDIAADALKAEAATVRDRVELVFGELPPAGDGHFALACCHSVLMYEPDPAQLLSRLVHLVAPGGLLSILSLNTDAIAMRSALQGRWHDALHGLETGREADSIYLPTAYHSRAQIVAGLESHGARQLAHYGVGIFTDHAPIADMADIADICELEWRAGCRDPYRQVARCFHLIAQRD